MFRCLLRQQSTHMQKLSSSSSSAQLQSVKRCVFIQQGNGCRESWLWYLQWFPWPQPGAQGQLTPQFGNADEYFPQPQNISPAPLSMEKAENSMSSLILQVRGMHSGLVPSLPPLEGGRFETHPGSFIITLNQMMVLQQWPVPVRSVGGICKNNQMRI